jgi:hypothetical protein
MGIRWRLAVVSITLRAAELKRYVEAQPKQRDLNPSLPEIERPYGNEKRRA